MLLQGILRRAVVRGLVAVNPAQLVDNPKQRPTQLPQPLSPVTVEQIRANMLQRTRIVRRRGPASDRAAKTRLASDLHGIGSETR